MKSLVFACSFLLCVGIVQRSSAQTPINSNPATAPDTVRILDFKNADRLSYKKIDSTNELITAAGNVSFQDGKTIFYADSAIHNKNLKTLEAFGNVHIVDNDTIHTRSQYLIYYIDKRQAILKRKASMTDGKGTLTSEEIFYDSNLKMGSYSNGGKVVTKDGTVLTSKEATYYSELKDVYFKRDVKLKNPGYDITTDSLLYNTQSQIANFITKTLIIDSNKSQIITSDGYYNLKNKTAKFNKRTIIRDKSLTVTGDDLAVDEKGIFNATGNAVLIDTSQGVSVIANRIRANRETNTFTATEHPLMIIKQDRDSVYLTADTLYSGKLTDLEKQSGNKFPKDTLKSIASINAEDSTNRNRYFQGFHNVRIFTDSLQAVSDSLFYSGRDSIFQLFTNPIVWTGNSQITGDTIYLFTKDKKPQHLFVFENALVIEKSAENLYNQIKGNTLNGYFDDGYINFMRVKGSSESVYYAKDDKQAFVGMNATHAEIIDMFFKEKKLDRIVCRNDVTGNLYPMTQIPDDKKLLNSFKWLDKKRPKTKFELFEDIPVTPPPPSSSVSQAGTPRPPKF